jgi:aspartate beta-hydroxylase
MYLNIVAALFLFPNSQKGKVCFAHSIDFYTHRTMKHLLVVVWLVGSTYVGEAFYATSPSHHRAIAVSALTERQQQFWEDVEGGLEGIERFYLKQNNGQNLERIRTFCASSQGLIPPPQGYASGHEPSEEHVPDLTAKPFWDTSDDPELFPWAAPLEASADIIQREFCEQLLNSNKFAADSVWQNQVMGAGWSAVRLQRLGVWNMENCQAFPETYELLRSLNIPLAVRGVCFARQAPGSGVQPHSDGRNFILTSHLGLSIPAANDGNECWIEVGGERRGWQEGKLTTLDTSFTHSTGNPTQQDRHVLILDFWHPELTTAERAALEFVYDLRNKFESGAVPFRKPRSLQQEEENTLGNWWKSVTGG